MVATPFFQYHTHCFLYLAVGGSDYTDVRTLLPVFDDNNRRRCFTIVILEDNVPEDNEMFQTLLTLVNGSDVTVDPAEATVTITDVDSKCITIYHQSHPIETRE